MSMKELRKAMRGLLAGRPQRIRERHLFDEIEEFSEESQFHIAVRNVQNGSVVTIRFDDKQGNTRGYSRLCVEGEDPIDHIRQLVALAKLEV